jgi:hypothetical protein
MDFSKYEFKPKEKIFLFAMIPLQLRHWCDFEKALVKEWLEFAKKNGLSTDVNDWYELREK